MTTLRNSEKTIASGGSGFRFNGEGNQVSYRCDATQVTTIDFDRNKIRGMATALSKKADEISMALDKCLVNTEVAYEAPLISTTASRRSSTTSLKRRQLHNFPNHTFGCGGRGRMDGS